MVSNFLTLTDQGGVLVINFLTLTDEGGVLVTNFLTLQYEDGVVVSYLMILADGGGWMGKNWQICLTNWAQFSSFGPP